MSQDPTKTKVIELLREWCDDPPVSVDEAVKVLSELVYPSKLERDEAEFEAWFHLWLESEMKRFGLSLSRDATKMGETEKVKRSARFKMKQAWLAARGVKTT
jgi:hypothetical protein